MNPKHPAVLPSVGSCGAAGTCTSKPPPRGANDRQADSGIGLLCTPTYMAVPMPITMTASRNSANHNQIRNAAGFRRLSPNGRPLPFVSSTGSGLVTDRGNGGGWAYAAPGLGTTNAVPHLGHLVFRPAALSGARIFAAQAGHTTDMGM